MSGHDRIKTKEGETKTETPIEVLQPYADTSTLDIYSASAPASTNLRPKVLLSAIRFRTLSFTD